MKNTATQWAEGPNLPIEASEVEKPPVATVDMAWLMASKAPMPVSRKAMKAAMVKVT